MEGSPAACCTTSRSRVYWLRLITGGNDRDKLHSRTWDSAYASIRCAVLQTDGLEQHSTRRYER